ATDAVSRALVLRDAGFARSWGRDSTSGDHAHDVGFLHDQEVLAVELDLGAGPFAEQHPVAGLDVGLDDLAGLVVAARPARNAFTLRCLLFGGVGDDDAGLRFFLGINTFHDHAVVQGTELGLGHKVSSQGAGRLKSLTDKLDL